MGVGVASVLLAVTARVAHAEPDFPHHPPVAWAALAVVVAVTVLAERTLGSLRTVLVGVGAPLAAVGVTFLAVTVGSAMGEAHAEAAAGEPLFAPSAVATALLAAASATMPPARRRRVRAVLWTVVLTLVLFAGHGSDTARALATLFGTVAGALVVRRASRPAPTAPRTDRTVAAHPRSIVVATLVALGAGTLVTLVVPEPDGVLSPFAGAMSDRATVLVGVLLVGAAWLVQRGRRTGIVLAAGLLVTLTAVLADVFLIEPLQDGFVQWQGMTTDEVEWQVTLLGAWAVPAAVLLAIVVLRGQLVRARFRATPTCDEDYLGMLRDGDAGTLGHMGTWRATRPGPTPTGSVPSPTACTATSP